MLPVFITKLTNSLCTDTLGMKKKNYICAKFLKLMENKIIKRVAAALVLLFASLIVTPSANAEFRYGPTAGVDFTNLKFKQDLIAVDQAIGGSAGIMAEMMFPGIGFGIDFGVIYQLRGATLHLDDRLMWSSQGFGAPRTMLHYVTIPFHLRFKYTNLGGLEETIAPLAFVGQNFGFLAGHNKISALKYAGGDVGIDFGLGVELFKKFQITGSYHLGATYALKTKILTDFSAQNRLWQVSVAWLF